MYAAVARRAREIGTLRVVGFSRGGILFKHQFPADGDYTFNVKGVTGYFQAVLGGISGERLEITVDGERVHLFDWDKEISNTTGRGRWTPKIPIKDAPPAGGVLICGGR